MIEQADAALRAWAQSICGDVPVTLAPPAREPKGSGVSLHLFGIAPNPPLRTSRRPPLQISLRYLVTVWAERPEEAHRMLGSLAFDALENDALEVEPEAVETAVWTALGLPPQPSIVLRITVRKERPEPETKPVSRTAFRLLQGSELRGVVLGAGNCPAPDCIVEIPAFRLTTTTDEQGRFRFAAVPHDPAGLTVRTQLGPHEKIYEFKDGALFQAPLELKLG